MRQVVKIGDAGIDEGWARRLSSGRSLAGAWVALATVGLAVMTACHVGPPSWIAAWEVRGMGVDDPVAAVLPLMWIPFVPALAALLPATASRPVLLGVQQAFSPGKGPRFQPTEAARLHGLAVLRRRLTATWVSGLVVIAAGAVWAQRSGSAPRPAPVRIALSGLVGRQDLPRGQVLVADAVESSRSWLEESTVHGTTTRTRWRLASPPGWSGPAPLAESVVVGQDDQGRLRDMARPAMVGRLRRIDSWTAFRLREQGLPASADALVLERSMGDEGDALDASVGGLLVCLAGFVMAMVGGAMRWKAGRL
jgi:hypothetical protein